MTSTVIHLYLAAHHRH